jgi:hypothetical protein
MDDYSGPEEEDYLNMLYEEETEIEREILGRIMTVTKYVINLRPEVMKWLEENVEDMKGNDYKDGDRKGWCVGNHDYRSHDSRSLTIFFRRRRDAMKFIKTWSSHKKPTTYLNYFKSDYRELVDGKLVKKERD